MVDIILGRIIRCFCDDPQILHKKALPLCPILKKKRPHTSGKLPKVLLIASAIVSGRKSVILRRPSFSASLLSRFLHLSATHSAAASQSRFPKRTVRTTGASYSVREIQQINLIARAKNPLSDLCLAECLRCPIMQLVRKLACGCLHASFSPASSLQLVANRERLDDSASECITPMYVFHAIGNPVRSNSAWLDPPHQEEDTESWIV